MPRKILLLLSACLLGAALPAQQTTFTKRLHFGRPNAVLTGVEIAADGYLANGITSQMSPPYTTANIFVHFDWDGNVLSTKVLEAPGKTYETWNAGLQRGPDGLLYSAGTSRQGITRHLLLAYDEQGDTIFTREYENVEVPNAYISTRSLLLLDDGFLFVSTGAQDSVPPDKPRMTAHRLDGDGGLLWARQYGAYSTYIQEGRSALALPGGKFLLGGVYGNTLYADKNFVSRTLLLRADSLGQPEWQWHSPPSRLEQGPRSMALAPDGGIVIATAIGTEEPVNPFFHDVFWDCYIYKISPAGQQLWGTYFRDGSRFPFQHFRKLISCSDGSGYVAAGRQMIFHGGTTSIFEENTVDEAGYIVKVSPEGDSLWARAILHPDMLSFYDQHDLYDIKEAPDGGYILAGQAMDGLQSPQGQQGWLLKLDEHGCLVPGCHLVSSTAEAAGPGREMKLYPNPATDVLHAYLSPGPLPPDAALRIVDRFGREAQRRSAPMADATYVLEIERLPAGYYVLQLLGGTGLLAAQPFIKN